MKRNEKGFTLIELLVVMAIIGILAAIAIPNFQAYRARGFDARAKSDLHNLATAEEAVFLANEEYVPCAGAECNNDNLPGFVASQGTELNAECAECGVAFTATASHASGSPEGQAGYTWDSAAGGFQGGGAGDAGAAGDAGDAGAAG